jgi:hypothetical protein
MKKNRLLILLSLILFSVSFSFAQPGDGGGDSDVPITGIEWLLVAGGLFGAKKIHSRFKERA